MDLHVIAITCCMFASVSREQISRWKTNTTNIISVPGATLRLSCPVNCALSGHFPLWSFNGNVLADGVNVNHAIIQKNRLSVKQNCGEQINNLIISSITKSDEGKYCCEAIFLKHCTDLELTDVNVVQLQNDSLICKTTKSSANYTFSNWEHQTTAGKHIRFLTEKSNEMIHFNNIANIPTYTKNGRYVCTVENVSIAYIDVSFSGKPICLEGDKEAFGQVGENILLTVKVYTSTFFRFNWKKGGLQLANNSKYTILRGETMTRVEMYNKHVEIEATSIGLQIQQLTEEDINVQYAVTIYSTKGNCTCALFLLRSETLLHRGLLFYVVTTFICTVVIFIVTARYAKTRKKTMDSN